MTGTDRGVRRARQQLADTEVVMASVTAIEAEGRRRRVVLVTDQRILVTGMRGDPATEFPLDGSTCTYHRVGGLLTLRAGDVESVVRDVDELAGRTIVELLAARTARFTAQEAVRDRRVRIDAI